ncbi:hypothetical protein V6Z11_A04G085800 [Gossypium hirsutum]
MSSSTYLTQNKKRKKLKYMSYPSKLESWLLVISINCPYSKKKTLKFYLLPISLSHSVRVLLPLPLHCSLHKVRNGPIYVKIFPLFQTFHSQIMKTCACKSRNM